MISIYVIGAIVVYTVAVLAVARFVGFNRLDD
jgi:hypothetical protein